MVEGLTFRVGQAVRLEFQLSETATEEGQFAMLISGFLSKAAAGRQVINEEAEKVQASSQARLSQTDHCLTRKGVKLFTMLIPFATFQNTVVAQCKKMATQNLESWHFVESCGILPIAVC